MLPAAQFGLIVENIGAGEVVVIAFLALVILGPDRIPEMARGAGRLLHNAKKFTSNLSGDMADVINDPAMQPIKELGEFAARPRQKLTEYALEAEAEERQKAASRQGPPADGEQAEHEQGDREQGDREQGDREQGGPEQADGEGRPPDGTDDEPAGRAGTEPPTEDANAPTDLPDHADPAKDPAERP